MSEVKSLLDKMRLSITQLRPNAMDDYVKDLILNINSKEERVVKDAIARYGCEYVWDTLGSRFPKIVVEVQDNIRRYYIDNGTTNGHLLVEAETVITDIENDNGISKQFSVNFKQFIYFSD